MLRHVAVLCAALALQASGASPAPNAAKTPDVRGKHLVLRPGSSVAVASPGQRVTLRLTVTPDAKIHVYAPGQPNYIPVALTLDASDDVKIWPAKYPVSRAMFFAPLQETVKVYDQPFRIAEDITLAATAALRQRASAKDKLTVTGTLSYQACDDQVCFVPESVPVRWTIPLVASAR